MASLIKWIGTVVILSVGIIIAYNYSTKAELEEVRVYKLKLPATEFVLGDKTNVYAAIELLFYDKEAAKEVSSNREIFSVLEKSFLDFKSSDFSTTESLISVKAKLFKDINKKLFPALNVRFYTNPKVY